MRRLDCWSSCLLSTSGQQSALPCPTRHQQQISVLNSWHRQSVPKVHKLLCIFSQSHSVHSFPEADLQVLLQQILCSHMMPT